MSQKRAKKPTRKNIRRQPNHTISHATTGAPNAKPKARAAVKKSAREAAFARLKRNAHDLGPAWKVDRLANPQQDAESNQDAQTSRQPREPAG